MDTVTQEEQQVAMELARMGRSGRRIALSLARRGPKPKPRFTRKLRPKPYRGNKRRCR